MSAEPKHRFSLTLTMVCLHLTGVIKVAFFQLFDGDIMSQLISHLDIKCSQSVSVSVHTLLSSFKQNESSCHLTSLPRVLQQSVLSELWNILNNALKIQIDHPQCCQMFQSRCFIEHFNIEYYIESLLLINQYFQYTVNLNHLSKMLWVVFFYDVYFK